MKIMLFTGGPGEEKALPGEQPEKELEELLGGETEMTPLNRRLTLVSRADGEAARLPIRYTLHRIGREPEPVPGDCAVVAMGPDGCLRDMTGNDQAAATSYIRPITI